MALIKISELPAASSASGSDQLAVNQAATTRRLTLDQLFQEGLTQLNIDNLRLDGNTLSATNANGDLTLAPNGSGIIKTAAKTIIGSTSVAPDGTLHVHTASAGAVTAAGQSDDLVIENSGAGGLSILTPNNVDGAIFFGDPENNSAGRIIYNHSGNLFGFYTSGTEKIRITDAPILFINETANLNMAIGLTINQGANDNEALALKSSDVGHAMTALAEADTYGVCRKAENTSGGLHIIGYKDADGLAGQALLLEGRLGEAADTGDTTSSDACIQLRGQVTNGGTSITSVANSGNLFVLENAGTVRVLVKGDGAFHITNVIDIAAGTGTDVSIAIALDAEDDVALVRCHQRTVYHDAGIAMTKWDESIKANEDDLKRLGVISSQGDFTIVHRMHSLLGGAIWQSHVERKELEQAIAETMPAIAARLEEIRAERKLAQLPN